MQVPGLGFVPLLPPWGGGAAAETAAAEAAAAETAAAKAAAAETAAAEAAAAETAAAKAAAAAGPENVSLSGEMLESELHLSS